MSEAHPSAGELREFFRGSLPSDLTRRIVRHLLAGCDSCSRAAAEHWPPQPPRPEELDASFARSLAGLRREPGCSEAEAAAVSTLLAELDRHPPRRQLVLAGNSRRFRNWALTERVLEDAYEAGYDDPEAALAKAELGVALAAALADSHHPAAVVADLRARAHATRANALRIRSDLDGAARDLQRAGRWLAHGTGDPLEEAFVVLREAYLAMERRAFDRAIRFFDRGLRIYRLVGDDHWVGRTLIDKGTACGYSGAPEKAIELIELGLRKLDPARDPRMALAGKHNLALFRCENGDLERAMSLVQELLPLHAARREQISLVRLRWLEGKLAQAQERLAQAEEAFVEVRDQFIERRIGFDAALVSLDLAAVYLQQGRGSELRRLASESLTIFQSLEVHREALVSLALFKKAVEMEQVSLRWIAELAAYLEKARRDPRLRFEPPGSPVVGG